MRRVRDFNAELRALNARARAVKARKIEQLGALVIATGADALDPQTLAGVLLDAAGSHDAMATEAWASKGAAFFQRRSRKTGRIAGNNRSRTGQEPGRDQAD
jgi:LPS O-antigen subunit length determinant protein (WzzB/FepE family)